ncbi:FG-GAP-like repeat-containing protein, partial [Candidatus Eisenbacteria bacterium]
GQGTAAVFFDADQDGDLDLYQANLTPGRNRFYRKQSAGYVDETRRSRLAGSGRTLSLSVLDLDLDGDSDIAAANYLGPVNIYHNLGAGRFALDETDSSAVAHLGCDGADLDGDLRPDLLLTAIGHPGRYLERSRIRFSSAPDEFLGGAFWLNDYMLPSFPHFCDFDLDGRIDLALGTAVSKAAIPPMQRFAAWVSMDEPAAGRAAPRFDNRDPAVWILFTNAGGGWMNEFSLGILEHYRRPTRGVLWLDADEDGAPDLLVAEESGKLTLFLNRCPVHGRGLEVVVRAGRENQMAVGAQVYLRTEGGIQTRQIEPGRADMRAADGIIHFGVGQDVSGLAVRWPHGGWQELEGIDPVTMRVEIIEDPDRTRSDPPEWLDAYNPPSMGLLGMERALLADPTNLELGWEYRQACHDAGQYARPVTFFRDQACPRAPFAWSLHGILANVHALTREGAKIDELTARAGDAVYELERMRLLYPETWIVEFLLGLNLLYWPQLFGQSEAAIAAFERCVRLQGARREAHLAETFLALGDAHGREGEIERAHEVWCEGREQFPANREIEWRLALDAGEIEAFCVSERGMDRMPEATISWLEDEIAHCPLAAERAALVQDPLVEPTGRPALSLQVAQELLDEHLFAGETTRCVASWQGVSPEPLWPHLHRGMALLTYGFSLGHLQEAETELELLCHGLGSTDSAYREILAAGYLGRGDIAMKLGKWRDAVGHYRQSRVAVAAHPHHRMRDLLPLSTDPSELWSPRMSEIPACDLQ